MYFVSFVEFVALQCVSIVMLADGRTTYHESAQAHSDAAPRRCSSNGGETENMEYLMNRYRGDTGSQRSSKQEQVVMEHAIGILRAAGMHINMGVHSTVCINHRSDTSIAQDCGHLLYFRCRYIKMQF